MRVYLSALCIIFCSIGISAQTFNNIVELNINAIDIEYVASKDRIFCAIRNDTEQTGQVCILNPSTTIVEDCIDLLFRPSRMVVSHDEKYLYVAHDGSNPNVISKIDIATETLVATIDLGRDIQFGDRSAVDLMPSPFNSNHLVVSLSYSVGNQLGVAIFEDDRELSVAYIENEFSPYYFADGFGPDGKLFVLNPYGFYTSTYGVIIDNDVISLELYDYVQPTGFITVLGDYIVDGFGEVWDISVTPPVTSSNTFDLEFYFGYVPLTAGVNNEKVIALESKMTDYYSPGTEYYISYFDIDNFQREEEFQVDLDPFKDYNQIITLKNNRQIATRGISSVAILTTCDESQNFDLDLPLLTGCLGQGLTVSATPGFENYIWSNGMTGEQIEIFEETQLSYSVIDENGCRSNESNTIFIEFEESTNNPRIDLSSNKQEFCKNDTLILTAKGNEFSYVFDYYLWSTGDTTNSIYVTESGEYTVKAIGTNGCDNFSYDTIRVNFSQDSIPATPTFTVERDTTLPCDVPSKELVGPDGYNIYSWSNGANTQRITVEEDGYFFLSVGSSNSCLSNPSEWQFITATSEIPQPTIQVSGNTLASSSAIGNQWFLNGEPLVGVTSQFYSPDQSGFYTVQVTIDGCKSLISEFINFELTNTINISEKPIISLYPNPASEMLNIEADASGVLSVYNAIGKKLLESDFYSKTVLDVSTLNSGIYICEFTFVNGQRISKKIIVN